MSIIFFEMELRIFVVLVEFMNGFEKKLDFSRNFKGEMLDFGYFVSNGYKENAWKIRDLTNAISKYFGVKIGILNFFHEVWMR